MNIPNTIIKLDRAENPYTDSLYPKYLKISYSRYPDPSYAALRQKVGKYVGYEKEWIGCGNGSDELIDLLIAQFVKKGEEIITCPPAFPMYEFFAKVRGVKVKKVLRNNQLEIDIKKIAKSISSKTKLIFIDSPGNPAGTLLDKEDLKKILKLKTVVVIDEAYFEYCNKTVIKLVKKFPNLIVLRTFSKWAGLAGLRIGYMVANPKIIKEFMDIKPPFNINSAAQAQALFALENKDLILKEISRLLPARDYISKKLSNFRQLETYAGYSSYVLVKIRGMESDKLVEQLKNRGILVKKVQQPLLLNALLIGLAPKKQIDALVKALKMILTTEEKSSNKG